MRRIKTIQEVEREKIAKELQKEQGSKKEGVALIALKRTVTQNNFAPSTTIRPNTSNPTPLTPVADNSCCIIQ